MRDLTVEQKAFPFTKKSESQSEGQDLGVSR